MRSRLLLAAAAAMTIPVAGCHGADTSPMPSSTQSATTTRAPAATPKPTDGLAPETRQWLVGLTGATVANNDDFHACSGESAACDPGNPSEATSFAIPSGAVSCTALALSRTFTCAVNGATFPLPPIPNPAEGHWVSNYIAQHGDEGWRIGNYVSTPIVAEGANPLPDNAKLVLSHLPEPQQDTVRLECASLGGGLVCADHLTGQGFHASRDDFTAFTFQGTPP
ncbi:MAG: hypothetical protein ACRDTV_23450 [Mycobacterium sp.]